MEEARIAMDYACVCVNVCVCVCSCLIENLQIEHHHILLSIFRQFVSGSWQRGWDEMEWMEGTGIRLLCGISGAFGADNWLTTLRERCTNCSNWNIFHIHGKGKAKIRIQIVYFHVEAQGETARGAVQELRSGEGEENSGLVVVGSICISCDDSIWAKPTRQVWSQRQIETIFAHTLHIRHVAQPVCVCVASINELFACYWIRGKRAKEQRDGWRERSMK